MKSLSQPKFFLLLVLAVVISCSNKGTETGNPGNEGSNGSETSPYTNEEFGVSGEYDSTWSATDQEIPSRGTAGDSGGGCSGCTAAPATPAPAPPTGINTSNSPSTVFTDGTSTVTVFYVTLSQTPSSLAAYLVDVFPTRTFLSYLNGQGLAGFRYDNPEEGATGGDRQEYYFLKGVTLLYVVTDLFEVNDGLEKFQTIVNSLRFE